MKGFRILKRKKSTSKKGTVVRVVPIKTTFYGPWGLKKIHKETIFARYGNIITVFIPEMLDVCVNSSTALESNNIIPPDLAPKSPSTFTVNIFDNSINTLGMMVVDSDNFSIIPLDMEWVPDGICGIMSTTITYII